jgi:transcription elongation factor Elf1
MSKCPKCSQFVSSATLNDVKIGNWNGVSYSCPFCFSVLSIAIDPVALKSDTISGVHDELVSVHQKLDAIQSYVAQIAQHLARK